MWSRSGCVHVPIFKGVWPVIYAVFIFLLLTIFVPWISTFLPGLVVPAQEG